MIGRGISEIEKGYLDRTNKLTHINNAESIFRNIETNYVRNSTHACNQYGIAYLKAAEYDLSFQKLSKSLSINPNEPSTLYSLGLFFATITDDYFNHIDYNPLMKSVPFPKTITLKTRNDIALFFYCKSLIPDNTNKESITRIKELLTLK